MKPTSNLGATTEPRKIINHTDSFLPHTYAFLPNLNPSDRETVDTIEATVPEDGREPLKKRIRDRDDDDDESSRKRPRANTLALLSAEPGELPEVPDSPPPVKEDLAKYTRERVKAGLRYINHTTATGKITPRTLTFLNLSKEAHKVALESETPSEKAVAVVQEYDRVYHAEAFLLQPQSAQALQRISNLTKLRRLQILTHYRDYIRPNLHDVRANNFKESSQGGRSKQAAAGTQHIRPPPRSWLQELAETDPSALRKHVHIGCGILGLDTDTMLALITHWEDRNRRMCQSGARVHNRMRLGPAWEAASPGPE